MSIGKSKDLFDILIGNPGSEKLQKTEKAEEFLESLGFRDFRVRLMGENAKLQLTQEQLALAMEKRNDILTGLKPLYTNILLDLEVRG